MLLRVIHTVNSVDNLNKNFIADDLDFVKLAGRRKSHNVVNLCKRGGKVEHLSATIDEYYKSEDCDPSVVNRVILSVGTNDIRRCRFGVGHLYYPVLNLMKNIRTYFPSAAIYVQSVLPVRYTEGRAENPRLVDNVYDVNKLLLKAAASIENCFYFDLFQKFLDNMNVPIARLYRDLVHLSRSGLCILARAFIQIVRGRNSCVINIL